MNTEHPWMWHWGGMSIFPVLMFIVFVIILFVCFGRWGCRMPWWGPGRHFKDREDSDSALEILKKRYARGEISKEEFEQMKKDILT